MYPLCDFITEYKTQLQKGQLQMAYKGLMEFMLGLKSHLKKRHPEFHVPDNFYQGYMDMSYFSFTPKSLAERKLKLAIVLLHEEVRFEIWLCGVNQSFQRKYRNLLMERGWNKYPLSPKVKGVVSIVEDTLVAAPDFHDLEKLMAEIEKRALEFAADIEDCLCV